MQTLKLLEARGLYQQNWPDLNLTPGWRVVLLLPSLHLYLPLNVFPVFLFQVFVSFRTIKQFYLNQDLEVSPWLPPDFLVTLLPCFFYFCRPSDSPSLSGGQKKLHFPICPPNWTTKCVVCVCCWTVGRKREASGGLLSQSSMFLWFIKPTCPPSTRRSFVNLFLPFCPQHTEVMTPLTTGQCGLCH